MEEDDIPAFAAVDAAAMANWGIAQAMDKASTGGEPRQQLVERWTRQGFRNDSEQAWLKVTDTETNELVAAAMWRFQLEEERPNPVTDKKELPAPTAEANGEVIKEVNEGAKRKGPSRPGVMGAMAEIWEDFKNEFIGNRPHASRPPNPSFHSLFFPFTYFNFFY